MIIPWNTDAPLYHFPFATIGLIVVNSAVFFATLSSEDPEAWMLAFGDGLHPQQWITSVFMHADLAHLVGNMIFLWGFGLVIEGKLGWWRFLLVYFGLGAFESGIVQVCMQHRPGYALGASGAIYGLLAMALAWAPRNEMNCLMFFSLRPIQVDISILSFVMLYVGFELLIALWTGFEMSSAVLHLAGAVPGFVVAVVLLKLGIVDCENWDAFAVWEGREGKARERRPDPRKEVERDRRRSTQRGGAATQFQQYLDESHPAAALALHEKMRQTDDRWRLSQDQLLSLIKALHKEKLWSQSVRPMVEYLRAAPDAASRVRLKLAQILIVHEKRPGRALSVLEKIPPDSLSSELQNTLRLLQSQARKMYDEGDLEVDDEDW